MMNCPHCGGALTLTAVEPPVVQPVEARREVLEAIGGGWHAMNFDQLSEILGKLRDLAPLNPAELELQRPIIHRHMAMIPMEISEGSSVEALDEPATVERVARP